MAEHLVGLLWRYESTVQDIRTFLDSQPNIQSIINQVDYTNYAGFSPLYAAVFKSKSVDILLELLKNGANVNQKCYGIAPLMQVFQWDVYSYETHCFDVIKLLLEYGADVNGENKSTSPLINFMTNPKFSVTKYFIPIIQIMFQKADKTTKDSTLNALIEHILHYQWEEEVALQNYIKAVNFLLDSEIFFAIDKMSHYHMLLAQYWDRYSLKKLQYIISLFKIILPHFIRHFSGNTPNEFKISFNGFITTLKSISANIPGADVFPDLLKNLFDNCIEENNKMQCDTLSNNRSLLQLLQDSYGTESEKANVTSDVVYEIFKRYAREEYPYFNDIMSHTIKNSNMMELYNLISREYFGNNYVIQPDFLYLVAKHLSKDDFLNFLLALLPGK